MNGSEPAAPAPPAPQQEEALAHDPYAALRHRDFRLLLGGGFITSAGAQMLGVALGWELYQRTRDPLCLGMIGLAQVVPILLFCLPAGQVADRFDRRYLCASAQGLCVCSSLVLAWLSWTQGPLPGIYFCLFANGVARAFHAPARTALLPRILPAEAFANAISWNSSTFQMSRVGGPALGGLALGLTGLAWPVYLFDALTSLINIVCLLSIRTRARVEAREPLTLSGLAGGLRFVWQNQVILGAITLDLFAVLLGGAVALLPIYAQDILQVGPLGLGWLTAAESIGAVGMALYLAHRAPLRRAGPTLLWSVAGFGLGTVVFGLSTNFWLSLAALAFCGACDNVSVVIRHTLMQLRTPDAMRGRVAAVSTVFIASSNELGQLESGIVARFCGAVFAAVSGGIGTLLVVLAATQLWPELRRLGTLNSPWREDHPPPNGPQGVTSQATPG